MGAPAQDSWSVQLGESLDLTEQYAYAAPNDPRSDGSSFTLALLDGETPQRSVLSLASNDGVKSIQCTAWTRNATLTLVFSASAQAVLQIPAGAYSGVLLHNEPRDGFFGPRITAIAIITLTVNAP